MSKGTETWFVLKNRYLLIANSTQWHFNIVNSLLVCEHRRINVSLTQIVSFSLACVAGVERGRGRG